MADEPKEPTLAEQIEAQRRAQINAQMNHDMERQRLGELIAREEAEKPADPA